LRRAGGRHHQRRYRSAIDDFFRGVQQGASGRKYPSVSLGGLQAEHEDKLIQAEELVSGACTHRSAFEIGRLVM